MTEDGKGVFGLPGDKKKALIDRMLSRPKRVAEQDGSGDPLPLPRSSVSEEFYRLDRLPGYEKILLPQIAGKRFKIDNPFFRVHDGVAGDTTSIQGRQFINFSSYNYLGLNGHPLVNQAAKHAIDRWGSTVSASRLVSGERAIHLELEAALAGLLGVEACICFVSGVTANVSTIGNLFGPKDLVVHDSRIHNSVLQGIQLSGAHRRSFPHNDWAALDDLLSQLRFRFERVLIVLEGLYSMDGDLPELTRFIDIKRRHRAFLMVDEAHSIGVLGRTGAGISEHLGIDAGDVDIWMGTLSKTLSSVGGYIAGEKALVEHLRYTSPGFLYSVGMSPPLAAASLEALRIMQAEPERIELLHQQSSLFLKLARQHGIDTGTSEGFAIIPAIIRNSLKAAKVSGALFSRGINVQPIIHPAVEEGMARLRFFITCGHTEEQLRYTVTALAEELDRVGSVV